MCKLELAPDTWLHRYRVQLLLALAALLPDGLSGSGWTGAQDNAFVWLTLAEALLLPALLCAADKQLAAAFGRSLSATRRPQRHKAPPLLVDSALLAPGVRHQHQHQHQDCERAKLAPQAAQPGARLGGQPLGQHAHLLLGPSSAHPDFMFALAGGAGRQARAGRLRAASALGGELRRWQAVAAGAAGSCHSLTGPPYPIFGGHESKLLANFALMNPRDPFGVGRQHRAPLAASLEAKGSKPGECGRAPRRRRARAGGALLDAGRLLFGRLAVGRRRRRHASSCGLFASSGTSTTADMNSLASRAQRHEWAAAGGRRRRSPACAGRLSPTSSLSTLIRKFNHDNYTSVCKQYEQEQRQIAAGHQRAPGGADGRAPELAASQLLGELLIDGLDGPGAPAPVAGAPGHLLYDHHQAISCRKGGLSYNFSLDARHSGAGQHRSQRSRVNPMLSGGKQLRESIERNNRHEGTSCGKTDSGAKTAPDSLLEATFAHHQPAQAWPQQQQQQQQRRSGSPIKLQELDSRRDAVLPAKLAAKTPAPDEPAAGGQGHSEPAPANNEPAAPIISNIASVQELLDKMNGIIATNGRGGRPAAADGAAPANSEKLAPPQAVWAAGGQSGLVVGRVGGEPPRPILMTNKQSEPAAEQAARELAANNEPASLDYASLPSVDDALSLVSVSSEFEYHDINRSLPLAQQQAPAAKRPIWSGAGARRASGGEPEAGPGGAKGRADERQQLGARPPDGATGTGDSGARLEALRFPSFFASKQPAGAGAQMGQRPGAGRAEPALAWPSQAVRPAVPTTNFSSSLLSLTAAKFAALNDLNNNSNSNCNNHNKHNNDTNNYDSGPRARGHANRGAKLAPLATGSSCTITKRSGARAPELFGSAGRRAGGPGEAQEGSSLPAENGNVRARIRRMELHQRQQQRLKSAPDLSGGAGGQQQSAGATGAARRAQQSATGAKTAPGSMIPVAVSQQRARHLAPARQAAPR